MLETDYRPIYISIITGWNYVSKDYTPKYHKQVFKLYFGYRFCSVKSNNFTYNSGSARFIQYDIIIKHCKNWSIIFSVYNWVVPVCYFQKYVSKLYSRFTSVHKHSLGIQM